ncbi:MAG: SsrA-binding protein SmpB [Elusimicrobia bacterium]|jgi:SsrA-binding protein|nr:SsrA-binding protein SmpB [Elusimicrobiota bacterium]
MAVAKNRKAYYQYEIIDEIEAGIKLTGAEVKSMRDNRVDIKHSYAKIINNEAYLLNTHINPYKQSSDEDYNPKRDRKLLLKKKEIKLLKKKIENKGVTLVPLKIYFKRGWAKVKLGVARGKTKKDKRDTLRRRVTEREMDRERKKYI